MLKKVIAICGSTKAASTNLKLIGTIEELARDQFEVSIFQSLEALPHFNPDLDHENPPEAIISFRNELRKHDGILICTPEYAMGVPGTLKNAIDWTVSSMEFSKKPVALITAASMGEKAHASLLDTLRIIESEVREETQLLISRAQTKISKDGKITDEKTLSEVIKLVAALATQMKREK
jgi:NAD(P)H-dependent FMN reductase